MNFTLSHPYAAGNQAWLSARDPHLERAGCGVVAFADLVRYRANHLPNEQIPLTQSVSAGVLSPKKYATFLAQFSHLYCRPWLPSGMSGVHLACAMQAFYNRYFPSRRAYWVVGNLVNDPLTHFCLQLAQNFPVILSLPPQLLGAPLPMFTDPDCTKNAPFRAGGGHFVTLIAVRTHKTQGILLEIVSWGKHYFVPYRDYLRVLTRPTGWLGGGWIAHHHGVPF